MRNTPSRLAIGSLIITAAVFAAFASSTGWRPIETGQDEPPTIPISVEDLQAACQTRNPYLVTPCYARGEQWDEPALVAFRDTDDNSDHHVLATHGQIGATNGTAYDPDRHFLYVAAYFKRGTALGPLGIGGIYMLDLESGTVEEWTTVPDAGRDMHAPEGEYWPDTRAQNSIGIVGLGDIEYGGDDELFVMNLWEREIFRYRTTDKALVQRIPIGAVDEPWYGSNARPFALAVQGGRLYHGVVNSAWRPRDDSAIEALVYSSEYDGSDMREVARFSLDHPRDAALRAGFGGGISGRWRAWRDGYNSVSGNPGFGVYPQPMLADLAFTNDGDMILGMRDRFGDMTFFDPSGANPPGEGAGIPAGDILIGRRDGDRWTVEPNPEFFSEDAGPGLGESRAVHDETGFGGLAHIPVTDRIITLGLAPERISSGGAYWFESDDGDNTAREQLYAWDPDYPNFGKANGLGDVELLCPLTIPTPTPTATRTATATRTTTPTPESTATATDIPYYEIYLPWGLKECPPKKRYIDVVLVLDRSTSMLRTIEGSDTPKNEAAIRAASRFVSSLQLEPDYLGRHDQVAIVGFNDLAWLEHPLGNDRDGALAALEVIRTKTEEGTRLDLGFEQGQAALDGGSTMPDNRQVMIVLTDGLPNRVPFTPPLRQEDTVIAAASVAKSRGTQVFTIGLGKPVDINPRMLISCSSNVYDYFYAPLPEDLDGIYERIAGRFFGCDEDELPPPTPCVPEFVHTDIMLVLDMSTSMQRTTASGTIKLDAALAAARLFKNQLDFEPDGWHRRDQLGIVGFNDEAWIETLLTHDEAELDRAINALPDRVAEGTRLDLAFEMGQEAIERSVRLPENRAILVLLTDGLPNRVPTPVPSGRQEDTVLAVAAAVKAKGTRVFTVGLGLPDDVLRTLLEDSASSPRDYYFAPDSEDLADIYRQIAGRIDACEPASLF